MTVYNMNKEEAERIAKERRAPIEPVRSFVVFRIVNGEPEFKTIWFEDEPYLPCEDCTQCETAITEGPIFYRIGPPI